MNTTLAKVIIAATCSLAFSALNIRADGMAARPVLVDDGTPGRF